MTMQAQKPEAIEHFNEVGKEELQWLINIYGTGRRKKSIARVYLSTGNR